VEEEKEGEWDLRKSVKKGFSSEDPLRIERRVTNPTLYQNG